MSTAKRYVHLTLLPLQRQGGARLQGNCEFRRREPDLGSACLGSGWQGSYTLRALDARKALTGRISVAASICVALVVEVLCIDLSALQFPLLWSDGDNAHSHPP